MKLTYYDNFAFACKTKNGAFAVNPGKSDDSLLFSVFTKPDRDKTRNGKDIPWSGEYEWGGVAIQLFPLHGDMLGAKLIAEDVRMVFLPVLSQQLSEDEIEILGNVDVLVLEVQETTPVLKKMVEEIDPKAIVVVGTGQEKFLTEMGAANTEASQDFTFTAGSLPPDTTLFVKLQTA